MTGAKTNAEGPDTAVEWFVILTVEYPVQAGVSGQSTITRTPTVGPNANRAAIYAWMRGQLPEEARNGTTVFYIAEPNRIGGAV